MKVDFKKQNVCTFEIFKSPRDSPRLIFCVLWRNYAYRTQDARLKKSVGMVYLDLATGAEPDSFITMWFAGMVKHVNFYLDPPTRVECDSFITMWLAGAVKNVNFYLDPAARVERDSFITKWLTCAVENANFYLDPATRVEPDSFITIWLAGAVKRVKIPSGLPSGNV